MSTEQPVQNWDDIEEGDTVEYIVRLGEGLTKKKPAKVYEVCGKGVLKILVGNDRSPRTVRTKDLERPKTAVPAASAPGTLPPPSPPAAPKLVLLPSAVLAPPVEAPGLVVPVPSPATVMSAAAVAAKAESSFETWLRMGEELLDEQELELLILDDEEHKIRSDEAEMYAQIAVLQEELKKIPERLAGIPERKRAVQQQIDAMKKRLT